MSLNPKITDQGAKVKLEWTPDPAGQGYRLYVDGVAVSRTFKPDAKSTTFDKPDAQPHAYGVQIMDVVGALEAVTLPPPPPPPPPGSKPTGYHWLGDYDHGFADFDMHDTRPNVFNDWAVGSTKDVTIVDKPMAWSSKCARVIVNNQNPSNSQSGQTVNLWESGAYGAPWVKGATVWCRVFFLLPNGQDPNWPGKIAPVGGDGVNNSWHVMAEWHKNDNNPGAIGPTSSKLEIALGQAGPALMFKPLGASSGLYIYETDVVQNQNDGPWAIPGGARIRGNVQPLKFNHVYDCMFRWVLSDTAGHVDWWVDGNQRLSADMATLFRRADGSVPGISFQAGMYRNFPTWAGNVTQTTNANEHIYIGPMVAGPTRASVGA